MISRKINLWLPVFIWMAIIFYLSNIPHLSSGLGLWDMALRKIAHMAEYTLLASLLARAIQGTWSDLSWSKMLAWTFFISVLFAMSDEYHQTYVAGRDGSWGDVLIDVCGLLIFILLDRFRRRVTGSLYEKN